MKIMTFC